MTNRKKRTESAAYWRSTRPSEIMRRGAMSIDISSKKDILIGITISLISSTLVGLSFTVKKLGLRRLSCKGVSAIHGGYGYLKDYIWWIGMTSMALGEVLNFVAYLFAPAIIVTCIGAFSILSTIFTSYIILGERISRKKRLGSLLIICATTVLILMIPEADKSMNFNELNVRLKQWDFIIYLIFVASVALTMVMILRNKEYSQSLMPHIIICSILGTLTIAVCKAYAIILDNYFTTKIIGSLVNPTSFFLTILLITCIIIQIIYLNKALDTSPASTVTPLYHCFFTTFVILFNSFFYKEFASLEAWQMAGAFLAFISINYGVFITQGWADSFGFAIFLIMSDISAREDFLQFIKRQLDRKPIKRKSNIPPNFENEFLDEKNHSCYFITRKNLLNGRITFAENLPSDPHNVHQETLSYASPGILTETNQSDNTNKINTSSIDPVRRDVLSMWKKRRLYKL